MLEVKSRRGRPKGTGIDDSDRIARLAELIKVHPGLKPTTAIRRMGISDPSVIRRLRDKYHLFARSDSAETPMPALTAPAPGSPEKSKAVPATRH